MEGEKKINAEKIRVQAAYLAMIEDAHIKYDSDPEFRAFVDEFGWWPS